MNAVKHNQLTIGIRAFRSLERSRKGSLRFRPREWGGATSAKIDQDHKIMSSFLKHVGDLAGKDLTLGPDGICFFIYKKFVIVIEVPKNRGGGFFQIYTRVCRLSSKEENRSAVLKQAMELNYMQEQTQGCCLGLDDDEVNLCYTSAVNGVSKDRFMSCLESFMATAERLNKRLEEAGEQHEGCITCQSMPHETYSCGQEQEHFHPAT